MDLKDFFSAAEARTDRWCEMNTVGRAWEAAMTQGQPADKLLAQAAQLLGEISPPMKTNLTPIFSGAPNGVSSTASRRDCAIAGCISIKGQKTVNMIIA